MTKGERIRQLRLNKRMSQSELANALNTTKQTISKYEKSIVTNIPSDKVEAMAILFNVSPEYILGWGEEDKKEKPIAQDDELSADMVELIDCIKKLPEDKIQMLLQVARSIR